MHISNVTITNYRCIKEDGFKSTEFNCIIGENNAGKSSILLALSLFFSGTAISASEYYDPSLPIEIEVTFSEIEEKDLNRLNAEHRERIRELLIDDDLKLTRYYGIDGKSDLMCNRQAPNDSRLKKEVITEIIKGKKGKELVASITSHLKEHGDKFKDVTQHKEIYSIVEEIVSKLPADQLTFQLSALPTGIPNSISNLLPEPIYIAAVKDLKDDIKTKESATFGKLLGILLKSVEKSNNLQKVLGSFNELHSMLNIIEKDGERIDERLDELIKIEKKIKSFLGENFPKSNVEIDIPKPELKQVLSNARILIDDGVKDTIETKGDGIKRALTFALLRTYIDHSKEQKRKSNIVEVDIKVEDKPEEGGENEKLEVGEQPYLFLFEEPELFLHPNAQRILFDALEKIAADGNQVFVTTHSPLFFSPQATGTFVKVVKQHSGRSKPYATFLTVDFLQERSLKDAFQIICYENNTAAFFANKVVLVEGDSDLIFLKEVARLMNADWNFDNKNIPVIAIDGKSNVKRFQDFFKSFRIETYAILDSDALIDGFELLVVDPEVKQARSSLLTELDKIAKQKGLSPQLDADKIKELIRRYTWREKYDKLKELSSLVRSGKPISEEDCLTIDYLFSEESNNLRRAVLIDNALDVTGKQELLSALRNHNIFILSYGAIEKYYPTGASGSDKPTKALSAIDLLSKCTDVKASLPKVTLKGCEHCELELIFEKIFNSTSKPVPELETA